MAIHPCATRTSSQFGFWLAARIDRALNFVARSNSVMLNRNRFSKWLPEFRGNLKAGCSVSDVDTSEDGDSNPSPWTSSAFRSCCAESMNSRRLCKAVQMKHFTFAPSVESADGSMSGSSEVTIPSSVGKNRPSEIEPPERL